MHRFVGIVMLLLLASPASANLLSNGSFELGQAPPADPGFMSLCPPSAYVITDWTVTQGEVDYCLVTLWECAEGDRSIDLNGTAGWCSLTGGVSQTFATVPDSIYRVSFWLSGNPAGAPDIKTVRVAAAGQQADFTFDITGRDIRNMGWMYRDWSFTATAGSTTLEFLSMTDGYYGPVVDNVTVNLDSGSTSAVEARDPTPLVSVSALPNPSFDQVRIVFTVSAWAPVSIAVYDVLGRQVLSVPRTIHSPGTHRVDWDGRGPDGARHTGIYFVTVSGPGFQITRRIVRIS